MFLDKRRKRRLNMSYLGFLLCFEFFSSATLILFGHFVFFSRVLSLGCSGLVVSRLPVQIIDRKTRLRNDL